MTKIQGEEAKPELTWIEPYNKQDNDSVIEENSYPIVETVKVVPREDEEILFHS